MEPTPEEAAGGGGAAADSAPLVCWVENVWAGIGFWVWEGKRTANCNFFKA